MNPSRRILAGLAAVAATAVPATVADAHERTSVKSVKAHAAKADAALERVGERVAAGDAAAAAVAFARNRVQTRRADAEAAKLLGRSAHGAARALRVVARQHDENAETYAGLIGHAAGDMQLDAAKAAASSVKGRDRAVAELTRLAGELPAPARGAVIRAIAAVSGDTGDEVATLSDALTSPAVAEDVRPWIELAISRATTGLATATTRLQELVPQLPAAAQPHVQAALGRVQGVVEQVTGILQGVLGGTIPEPTGDATSGPAVPLDIPLPSGLPIPLGR